MNPTTKIFLLNLNTAIFAPVSFLVDLEYIVISMNANFNFILIVSMNIAEIQENLVALYAKGISLSNFT